MVDERTAKLLSLMGISQWSRVFPPARPTVSEWALLAHKVRGCVHCVLSECRESTVFGAGSETAVWFFVGAAPKIDEERSREPLVGRAGQLFNGMLAALDLSRDQVFMTNIVKCRPPDDRDLDPGEVAACLPHLLEQITCVQPRVVVALGQVAAQGLLRTAKSMNELRGQLWYCQDIPVIVTYDPDYLLVHPCEKAEAWIDLKRARALLS